MPEQKKPTHYIRFVFPYDTPQQFSLDDNDLYMSKESQNIAKWLLEDVQDYEDLSISDEQAIEAETGMEYKIVYLKGTRAALEEYADIELNVTGTEFEDLLTPILTITGTTEP